MSRSIESALKKARITRVVNLSSVGADLPDKTGPINGLHDHEERLNKIRDWGVIHLRATYFMENVFIILRPLYFLSNEAPLTEKTLDRGLKICLK